MYLHMFDIVHTAFSYERDLNICSFLCDTSISKEKGSSLRLICNAHAGFLLCEDSWLAVEQLVIAHNNRTGSNAKTDWVLKLSLDNYFTL